MTANVPATIAPEDKPAQPKRITKKIRGHRDVAAPTPTAPTAG